MPSSPVAPGDVLAGKYKVERVLGIGGMGIVVAARHLQLEEPVAIKFMLEDALKIPDAVARFLREAKAAARLKSEHVAKVSDVGTLDTGSPYMVMEYLEGKDLGELSQQRGPLPPQDVVDYILEACEALAEAHSIGIVHRDLKPANLFLANRPGGASVVKVLDFGISKITSPGGKDVRVTGTTTLVGSPTYMSPEQLKASRDVDARTDVWALGVTMYELLTGKVPYEADTMPMLCAKILTEAPLDIATVRADLPPGLRDVVMRCLHSDLTTRVQNVAELANALAPFGSEHSQQWVHRASMLLNATPSARGPRVGSMPQMPSSPALDAEPTFHERRQSAKTATSFGTSQVSPGLPKGMLVGVAIGCLVLGSVAMFVMGRSSKTTAVAQDAAVATASTTMPATTASLAPSVTVAAAPSASASATPSATPAKPSEAKTKPPPPKPVLPVGGGEDDLYGARR